MLCVQRRYQNSTNLGEVDLVVGTSYGVPAAIGCTGGAICSKAFAEGGMASASAVGSMAADGRLSRPAQKQRFNDQHFATHAIGPYCGS